jgi:hypothetical protein
MFAVRGTVFTYEAVREWEAKLTPALAEDLRRRRRGKAGCCWGVVQNRVTREAGLTLPRRMIAPSCFQR